MLTLHSKLCTRVYSHHVHYAANKEIRYIHPQAIQPALLRYVLHQPLCSDDAVSVEVCRRTDRQGSDSRHYGSAVLVYGPDEKVRQG